MHNKHNKVLKYILNILVELSVVGCQDQINGLWVYSREYYLKLLR